MKPTVRLIGFLGILTLVAVSALGQDRYLWRTAADIVEGVRGNVMGTVVEVDAARRQLQLETDEDRYQRITVLTDAVSTQYNGFGTVINDSPEIFTGSAGFANVRVGDRVDIRGTGRAPGRVMADQVTLRGRAVEAPQVGVGSTRPPTSVSTPASTAQVDVLSPGAPEGSIRQINRSSGRIVIQTSGRRMITVRTTRNTPVYYRGETYRVDNLEIGDVIRVDTDPRDAAADDVSARSIEVIRSVQEAGTAGPSDVRVTSVVGRVTRVDRTADLIRVDSERGEVRVDMIRAVDSTGRRISAADLQVGDRVDITGSYSANSDLFVASTVRFGPGVRIPEPDEGEEEDDEEGELGDLVRVSFSGTITESLQTSPTLVLRDRSNGRTVHLFVTEDFIYRTKTGGYASADRLKVGDSVLVKAFRDDDDNLIAQTIRIR